MCSCLRPLTEASQPSRSLSPTPQILPRLPPTRPLPLALSPNPLESPTPLTARTGGGNRRRRRKRRKMTKTTRGMRTTKLREVTLPPPGVAVIQALRLSGPALSVRPPSPTTRSTRVTWRWSTARCNIFPLITLRLSTFFFPLNVFFLLQSSPVVSVEAPSAHRPACDVMNVSFMKATRESSTASESAAFTVEIINVQFKDNCMLV